MDIQPNKETEMDNRYLNAERTLAAALDWTRIDYAGLDDTRKCRAQGIAPGATESCDVPAWARSSDDCVSLMVAHGCFVTAEVTSDGAPVMTARWKGADGFGESISVATAGHADKEAAFRFAAVLGVTSKVETESQGRELRALVQA